MSTKNSWFPRKKSERRRVRFFGGVAITLFATLIGLSFLGSAFYGHLLRSPNVAAVVSAVLTDLANTDRAHSGIGALTSNPILVQAAQAKADDMAAKEYFAHISPDGVDPWHWFAQAGYSFAYAGENLAVDFSDSGDVNTAWMNSPEHRKNILDAHYTEIGIATAQGMYEGRLTTFVVQEFGAPAIKKANSPQESVQTLVPENPAIIATAEPAHNVLGAASSPTPPAPSGRAEAVNMPTLVSPTIAMSTSHEVASPLSPEELILGFPRTTLRYVYYVIGILILFALALETGFEIRWHHRRHALRAIALLSVMVVLLSVADAFFFTTPILAASFR